MIVRWRWKVAPGHDEGDCFHNRDIEMNRASEKAIGVFDSGVGGLTVLEALRQTLPHEDFVYLGDTARVPYGNRTPQTIVRYATSCARQLVERDVKALVIACNTASAHALSALRSTFHIPVFGVIEPVSQMAVDVSQSGIIGVIGTRATIASDCYRRAIANLSPTARVYAQPCPLFVPLVEEGWVDTLPARIIVKTYIGEFLKSMNLMQEGDFCVKNYSEKKKENGIIDTLILGCTHYPVLRDAIDMALNDYGVEVTLCDCGVATARALECALREGEMMHTRRELGSTSYLVTDDPELFTSIGRSFMKQPPVNVEHIDIL